MVVSGTIKGYMAPVTWSLTGVGEQMQDYVVLYKKTSANASAVWSFIRTGQTQAELTPLQPLSTYITWVLGYTATGRVYGSNEIQFVTTLGTVELLNQTSNTD